MIPVLSEIEARELDQQTIQSGHLSEQGLMENAGRLSAQHFVDIIPDCFNKKVLVTAGKGNNGGDGIIVHYYLQKYGVTSTLLVMSESELKRPLFQRYDIPGDTVKILDETLEFGEYDWIVDAIFGIGLSRPVEGRYAGLLQQIATHNNVISIDIPSGIYTDTGITAGISVKAQCTVTMGYPKSGHFLNDGLRAAGELKVLDIGFKPSGQDQFTKFQITKQDVSNIIRPVDIHAYKYSKGRLVLFAGSKGMTGAAVLAANAAYRTGCGIIHCVIPDSINTIIETLLLETLTCPVDDEGRGYLLEKDYANVADGLKWGDVLLCGPGLSTDSSSIKLTGKVLKQNDKPLILDASGFEPLISGSLSIKDLPRNSILTPHKGEFARLFNLGVDEVNHDPVGCCENILHQLEGRILILKGAPTIIVTSSGQLLFMTHGSPLLATAGTGDVLTGILGGLLAQGYSAEDAAILGTFLHAESAHIFGKDYSNGLIASDLVDLIPIAIKNLQNVI